MPLISRKTYCRANDTSKGELTEFAPKTSRFVGNIRHEIYANLTALMTHVFLHAIVRLFVSIQILLAQKGFAALSTLKWTRSYLVCLYVRLVRILGREVFTAGVTNVRSNTRVRVGMLVQQVLRAEAKMIRQSPLLPYTFISRNHFQSVNMSCLYLFPQVSQGHDFT